MNDQTNAQWIEDAASCVAVKTIRTASEVAVHLMRATTMTIIQQLHQCKTPEDLKSLIVTLQDAIDAETVEQIVIGSGV